MFFSGVFKKIKFLNNKYFFFAYLNSSYGSFWSFHDQGKTTTDSLVIDKEIKLPFFFLYSLFFSFVLVVELCHIIWWVYGEWFILVLVKGMLVGATNIKLKVFSFSGNFPEILSLIFTLNINVIDYKNWFTGKFSESRDKKLWVFFSKLWKARLNDEVMRIYC